MSRLETEVQYLKGVGPRGATSLQKLGIRTVEDALFNFPRRYEDRRNLPPIRSLQPGQTATILGQLISVDARPIRGGRVISSAIVRDGTGKITLTWFNQPWVKRQLEGKTGSVVAFGMVKQTVAGLEMASPEWEFVADDEAAEAFARIMPVYALSDGVGQRTVRAACAGALAYLDEMPDPLPPELRRREKLPDLAWSLRQIHAPDSEIDRLRARSRLVFEEFFYLQCGLAQRKQSTQTEVGIAFPIKALLAGETVAAAEARTLFDPAERTGLQGQPLMAQVEAMLPFTLTGAQQRVVREIWDDMAKPFPMNRLVQGDVGSGKTAVAACALLAAVRSGYQTALMAPTEILAEQHSIGLRRIFEPLGIRVELFVGKNSAAQRRTLQAKAESGEVDLAVGTHALIQDAVKFRNLGLAIIDEQHRFGVMQRKALRDKSEASPDVLVMTATPIPRTLTMTLYGDLDVSIIDELPPGRTPIKTHWKTTSQRDWVYERVREVIGQGRQAFVVCPLVSETEKMNAQAAEDLYSRLQNEVLPDLRIALLHGQMKAKEKEDIMARFRDREFDILVSTTVIEVGVDVPNASVMVIEDANRFGLAQLHQLRGRVGRGAHASFCVLIADDSSEDVRQRMEIMRETTDGFRIADEDLRLRGPGVIAGTQQSGQSGLRIADLVADSKMLTVARAAAIREVGLNPGLTGDEWELARQRVAEPRNDMAVVTVS